MKQLLLAVLLAVITACSGQRVTEYTGTAMNAATPDAEGSLRLTLYSRTDTSFGGVIELGAPLKGTGGAYAWLEGSALRVVTVGAESGDTIKWYSPVADAALGGRFDVIGGPRSGQSGTWRANLVAGLPATAATLRAPRSVPVPSPIALWPTLVLILIAGAFGRWILAAPRSHLAGVPLRATSSHLAGIGGWLLFFFVARVLSLFVWGSQFFKSFHNYGVSAGLGAAVTGLQPLIVLETAMSLVGLPLTLLGLVLLARRSPYAPRFWFAFLVVTSVYSAVDVVAMHFIRPGLARLVGPTTQPDTGKGSQTIGAAAFGLLWALYWAVSLRVRATFGATATDRTFTASAAATSMTAAADPAPTPARRRPAWRRVVVRGLAVTVAILVMLFAYGLWVTRATPYEVARGSDVREVAAGRWTWESDSAGCRGAHTIAFESGGKVMTITSGDIATAEPTTYDILRVTQSSIRGAIRGEKRLTSAGDPVVWDLVLTGPDEYRWHRTDWPSTPWSFTGKIHRCPALTPAEAAVPAR